MSSRPRLPLTPLMLALAALGAALPAAESPTPATDPRSALDDAARTQAGSPAVLASQAALAEAKALYRKAQFVECREQVETAVRLDPSNAEAASLREDVLAVLSQRDNRLQMAATWFRTLQDVRTQEIAVRIAGLVRTGDEKLARGDYREAELDYDRAAVGLKSFPYPFDWGALPQAIEGKRLEAAARTRAQDQSRADAARTEAQERARTAARLQEQALADKVDELMRRAREAYSRKDFRRAEVDAWNAYELDRRREDARDLYLDARREGHEAFDDKHESERLEKITRVNEEVHKSLIPQTELLVYPEDWARRTLRKPREIGSSKEETWMSALRDRLEQRVTFEFQDQPFEDVIAFLRQVTGSNIIVAPEVIANNGGGTVTLKVKDMRFGDALKWILELTNLHYALQDQAIYISNQQITGAVVLRLYDVADLIQHPRDMPGRELAFSSGGGEGGAIDLFAAGNAAEVKAPDPQELVDFIRNNVAKDSWEVADSGAGIEERGGSVLFISQTPEIHTQIEQLLASQRNLSSLQVSIDIRILQVEKNFLEEFGVDWRNSGNVVPSASQGGSSLASTSGYTRVNSETALLGSVTNRLGGNAVDPNWSSTDGRRGLALDVSHSPFSFLNTDQVHLILQAAETTSDSQTLEHPQLTCYNGQRAHAAFMNQLAYIADYEIVSSNYDPKITVLTSGNIIDVRPVVSSDRKYITMEVRPASVTPQGIFTDTIVGFRVVGTSSGNGGGRGVIIPGISYPIEMPNMLVRSLSSTVMIPDKASLLLGGFQNSIRESQRVGIPFLSNIPFLGRLFSRTGTYEKDNKTFYLLRAEIIDLAEKDAVQ